MLFGEYRYNVDSQGRVMMPPRCRHKFQDGITLYYDLENGCIAGCAPRGITSGEVLSNFHLVFQRSLDAKGRITIPAKLRQVAQIQDTVVIVALEDYLELWSEKKWELEEARAWAEAAATYKELPQEVRIMYERSLLEVAKHCDDANLPKLMSRAGGKRLR